MNIGHFYNSPVIFPPINPDDPNDGKPSDHAVPVCRPYTDRFNPPIRNFKIVKYRPITDSSLRTFGEWITSENWNCIDDNSSPTEQAHQLENILFSKLNEICPEKSMKIGDQDKPFITAELKSLHRKKSREYCKRGKSNKYLELKKNF